MDDALALARAFLKRAEGLALTAKADSGGRIFAGYGHTPGTGVLRLGEAIDQAQADDWLDLDIAVASRRLAGVVKADALVRLSAHQHAALIGFVFNLGAEPGWRLWTLVGQGRLDAVPAELMRFDKVHDVHSGALVEVRGLKNRRAAEVTLWETADTDAAVAVAAAVPAPSSAETRDVATPPTPQPVKPLIQSKSFVTSAATVVATTASVAAPLAQQAQDAVKATSDTIAPYADHSDLVGHALGALAVLGATLSVLTLVLIWLKAHNARRA